MGLIALPLSIALGIASLPAGVDAALPAPALGIHTAILAGVVVALFGGCRVQVSGPTAAFVPIILLIVMEHGYDGLLIATMMAGVILIIMGLSGLGTFIKYIPWPVTSGFTTGIAVSIMLTQVPDFLGLPAEAGGMPGAFWAKLEWLASVVGLSNPVAFLLALGSLVLIILWPRLGFRTVPGSIAALFLATLTVLLLGLAENSGVQTIGSKFGAAAIPSGLPMPVFPEITMEKLRSLLAPATAIALLGAIESLLSAVVADSLTGKRHDSRSELIGQGLANLVCPFFGGLPATGAIARTSANIKNGAQTPLASIVHAATLLAIILLAAPWAVHLPMPAMAAILISVGLRMGEWHEMARLRKIARSDAAVMLTTFALTVVFDLVIAIEIGMVLAAFLFIKRVAETTEVSLVTSSDELESPEQLAHGKDIPEGVMVYRIFGPFLFGAAEKLQNALERVAGVPQVLIIRMHLVTAMDATGLHALETIVLRMREQGRIVVLSGVHQQPLALMRRSGFVDCLGRENFSGSFDQALERARAFLHQRQGAR